MGGMWRSELAKLVCDENILRTYLAKRRPRLRVTSGSGLLDDMDEVSVNPSVLFPEVLLGGVRMNS